jgi:hypothetical protein
LVEIVEKLIAQHGKNTVFVTATTGLAACAVGGTTVHQFAGDMGLICFPDSDFIFGSSPFKLRVHGHMTIIDIIYTDLLAHDKSDQ